MESLRIKVSPKQASKLRNGHKVRIAPALEGEGIILLVHPERHCQIARSFRAGKGKDIQLLPDEIQSNKTPELEGKGIFGKKFDKDVQKLIGKKAKDDLYQESKRLKAPAKAAVQRGADEAIDFIDGGSLLGKKFDKDVQKLIGKKAKEDLYKESKRLKAPAKAAIQRGADKANDFIDGGSLFGKKFDNDVQKLIGKKAKEDLYKESKRLKEPAKAAIQRGADKAIGYIDGGSILGRNGNLIHSHMVHPALLSQPFATNFQFQSTLPVSIQKFASGSGLFL